MSGIRSGRRAFLALGLFMSLAARADLYEAALAYEKKDFARSFELYRELAELGQSEAQESLAVMYVNGEGIKRDNVLGYAWATIALEQGAHAAAQGIVDQLSPHLNDAARSRVVALVAQFGQEALQKTVLPRPRDPLKQTVFPPLKCAMKSPVNPDNYYPREAIQQGVSGTVLLEAKIWGDGRAHDPRAEYSIPERVFEAAGLAVSFATGFRPDVENGAAVPCTMRFKVNFTMQSSRPSDVLKENVDEIRVRAERGDPRSQLAYALILENRSDLKPSGEDVVYWYVKAARAGLPVAQFKVGYYTMNASPADKDEVKAVFWLDKAAGAGNPDAQIMLSNYYLRDMSNSVDVGKAVALMEAASTRSLEARFHLAGVRATYPDASIRDPKRALELAGPGFGSYDANPVAFEIRAAIHAALGDFAGAQKDQARAVGMAKKFHWNTAPQEARLEVYKANKAWTGDLFAFY